MPYFHDGFFLRFGAGVGVLTGSVTPQGGTSVDMSGTPLQLEFSLGGTPARGLVLGAGLFAFVSGSPTYSVPYAGEQFNLDGGTFASEILGPFIDLYPNLQHGFHIELSAGAAFVSAGNGDSKTVCPASLNGICVAVAAPGASYGGTGLGLVAGIGYEAWVGQQASLGGMARLIYVSSRLSPDAAGYLDVDVHAYVPSLMVTATFN